MKLTGVVSRHKRWLIPFALLGFIIGCGLWFRSLSSVVVTIVNHGDETMNEVVLHLADAQHLTGTISVGSEKRVRVYPRRDSHLEITFTDKEGINHRLNIGGYLTSGIHGKIKVEVRKGWTVFVQDETRIGLF